jgi:hypothetical protein
MQIISSRSSGIIFHKAGEQKSVVYKENLKWKKTRTPVVVTRKTLI